jgi:hypothetical protein
MEARHWSTPRNFKGFGGTPPDHTLQDQTQDYARMVLESDPEVCLSLLGHLATLKMLRLTLFECLSRKPRRTPRLPQKFPELLAQWNGMFRNVR